MTGHLPLLPGAAFVAAGAGPLVDPFLDNAFLQRALVAGILVEIGRAHV